MADTASDSWTSKNPEDMSLEELADASRHLVAVVEDTRKQLEWQNAAQIQVQAQINTRFGLNPNTLPPLASIAPYPLDTIKEFTFPVLPDPAEVDQEEAAPADNGVTLPTDHPVN